MNDEVCDALEHLANTLQAVVENKPAGIGSGALRALSARVAEAKSIVAKAREAAKRNPVATLQDKA